MPIPTEDGLRLVISISLGRRLVSQLDLLSSFQCWLRMPQLTEGLVAMRGTPGPTMDQSMKAIRYPWMSSSLDVAACGRGAGWAGGFTSKLKNMSWT